MTTVTTIETATGNVTINSELFQAYLNEAFEYLDTAAEATNNFKEVVETVAETTKLPKATVSKYFKARFNQATQDAKQLGELFGALDEAVEG